MKKILVVLSMVLLILFIGGCNKEIKPLETHETAINSTSDNLTENITKIENISEPINLTENTSVIEDVPVLGNQSDKSCLVDEDCIKACLGCCVCGKGMDAYNKEYIRKLGVDPLGDCKGPTIQGCRVYVGYTLPICENNTCILFQIGDCQKGEDCTSSQEYGCVNKKACSRIITCKPDEKWNCTYCKEGFCSDNP